MNRRLFFSQTATLALSACAFGRSGDGEPAHYDLGIDPTPATGARLSRSLALAEVSAAAWLQTQAILYRLTYQEPAQLQAYARSRWTAAPPVLLTQRLRIALSGSSARSVTMVADALASDDILTSDIDLFEQTVDSATASRALIRMHATLIEGASRKVRVQRTFRIDIACPSVDAPGAVRGLRSAADALIGELIDWIAVSTRA